MGPPSRPAASPPSSAAVSPAAPPPEIRFILEDAAARLAEAGAIVREVALPAPLSAYQAVAWTINWAESFSIHGKAFSCPTAISTSSHS